MTVFIGYIGVLDVSVTDDPEYTDDGFVDEVWVIASDPASEVEGFRVRHDGTFMEAWRIGAREIRKRGGVVVNRPRLAPAPQEAPHPGVERGKRGAHGALGPDVRVQEPPRGEEVRQGPRRRARRGMGLLTPPRRKAGLFVSFTTGADRPPHPVPVVGWLPVSRGRDQVGRVATSPWGPSPPRTPARTTPPSLSLFCPCLPAFHLVRALSGAGGGLARR